MNDGDPTLVTVGTHTGVGALAAAITTAVSRFFAGREAQEVSTRLAVIDERLAHLSALFEKHSDVAERVALLERDVRALHERLDGKRVRR